MPIRISICNGVRILTEHMPNVRSAAIGFFIGVGSRHETDFEMVQPILLSICYSKAPQPVLPLHLPKKWMLWVGK